MIPADHRARVHLARKIVGRIDEDRAKWNGITETWIASLLAEVEEDGAEIVAETHGWTECCDGSFKVTRHASGCRGGACPCPRVACECVRGGV